MATQTVEFLAETGLALTVKRFAIGSDTVIDTVAATEQTNRKGKYRVAYTDAPAAEYELFAFDNGVVAASWYVTLTLSTATFQAYGRAGSVPILDMPASPTIERVEGDIDAIRFSWPADGSTITGQVSKAGGSYAAVTGAISQRADESGVYWYQLAYNAADRQLGSVRYAFTDGTYTRFVNLLVNPASAEVDLDPVLNAIDTLRGADDDTLKTLSDQIDGVAGATFDTSTDSLEAIRNRGDAAWITGAGGGGGSTTISDEDIQEIVAGVTAVAPRICDSSAGTFRMRAGDTWIQDFTVVTTGADKFIVAVKNDAADDDTAAVLLIESVDGLERINGAVPEDAWRRLSH